jgi:hypothetical protein
VRNETHGVFSYCKDARSHAQGWHGSAAKTESATAVKHVALSKLNRKILKLAGSSWQCNGC